MKIPNKIYWNFPFWTLLIPLFFPISCLTVVGTANAAPITLGTATNYGLLYTAKGTAALLVPYGSIIREATHSWLTVIYLAAAANILAALLAILVLRPLRRAFIERSMAEKAAERIAAARSRVTVPA